VQRVTPFQGRAVSRFPRKRLKTSRSDLDHEAAASGGEKVVDRERGQRGSRRVGLPGAENWRLLTVAKTVRFSGLHG